jgi:hypothetical protein
LKIVQKFRREFYACDEQMIPCPRAGDVKRMAFGVAHLFQIGILGSGLDARSQRLTAANRRLA